MLHRSWWGVSIAAWLIAQTPIPMGGGRWVLTVDAADSQVVIQVGKAGVFGFAGHAHEIAATDMQGQVTAVRIWHGTGHRGWWHRPCQGRGRCPVRAQGEASR
jgi:hypothetical protein